MPPPTPKAYQQHSKHSRCTAHNALDVIVLRTWMFLCPQVLGSVKYMVVLLCLQLLSRQLQLIQTLQHLTLTSGLRQLLRNMEVSESS